MEIPVTPPSRKLFGTRNPCRPTNANRTPIPVKKMERIEKIECQFIFVGILIKEFCCSLACIKSMQLFIYSFFLTQDLINCEGIFFIFHFYFGHPVTGKRFPYFFIIGFTYKDLSFFGCPL